MNTKKLSKGLIVVGLLALFQAGLRMYFALANSGVLGLQAMDSVHDMISTPMTNGDWTFLTVMFGIIGVIGLITAVGLLLSTAWGYYGTIAVSAVTIAYDAWAMFAIQGSAVLGIVLPAVFIAYLVARRGSLLDLEVPPHEGSGGVRD